jgi:hypothetical protein
MTLPATTPATYYHNQSGHAVDGIWASPCLDLVRGGYLGQGVFPGDHRPIWFELSYEQAFGHTLPKILKPQVHQLQMRDPRCVKKFNAPRIPPPGPSKALTPQ